MICSSVDSKSIKLSESVRVILMKIKCLIFCVAISAITSPMYVSAQSSLFGSKEEPKIVVNNRIVAKVNGKAISVVDVMKKMDVLFLRQFPEYTNSAQARFQYYQLNWKYVLSELIDKELILADAEEVKLPISAGDVRQEMESMFGPNIIANLDKVGLTFDEAYKIVQGDITIRRMLYVRVHNKVMKQVTPQDVRVAYEQYTKDNVRSDVWKYNVVSIRDKDPVTGAETANISYKMLAEDSLPLNQLIQKIEDIQSLSKSSKVTISEEFQHNEKEISEAYKEILTKLQPGQFSQPISQISRADKSTVYRIFFLREIVHGGIIPFNEVENQLKDKLVDEAIGKETDKYLDKLRMHFDVKESYLKELVPDDFQPFALK
jgi:hypothetical protein